MTYSEDFDDRLRSGLATLAREAIPDGAAPVVELPSVLPSRDSAPRRVSTRAIAAAVAAVIAIGAALTATVVLDGANTHRPETPLPAWTKVEGFPLSPRAYQTAVFTGSEAIVWGGRSDPAGGATAATAPASSNAPLISLGDGAAFDVESGEWNVLPSAPLAGRFGAVGAWTGSEVLVVGGMRDGAGPSGGIGFLHDGAAYDPSLNRWRRIPDAPGCPLFGAWTGTRLVVGGSCADQPGAALVVAAFDPRRNQWTTLPSPGAASQIVSAAGRVFAWTNGSNRGAVLDPRTRRWSPLPALPHGARSESFVAAFDGRLAVVGLRQDPETSGPDHATVDVFDPRTQAWRPFESGSVGPPLAGSEVAGARGALVWSSAGSLGSFSSRSSAASVPGAEFSELGGAPVPLDRTGASLVAIGDRRFFLWGGRLAGNEHDQTNYPTRDGVIVRLP